MILKPTIFIKFSTSKKMSVSGSPTHINYKL